MLFFSIFEERAASLSRVPCASRAVEFFRTG